MEKISETFANRWFTATFTWVDGLLEGVELLEGARPVTGPLSPCGAELERIITEYDLLGADSWPDLPLDRSRLTPFTALVLDTLRREVPRGGVTTYGRLAQRCGSPRAARAVGGVMAANPWPLLIPCHRVLAANLGLGGFGPGLPLKRTLLTLEGALPLK
jgi:methylated-DNA-[protein]-cysteine S-methyltransferase